MIEIIVIGGFFLAAYLYSLWFGRRSPMGSGVVSSPATKTVCYRTQDALTDYTFAFQEQSDASWRAYIVKQPDYGSRPTGLHATHRLVDDDGRYYVCWTDPLWSITDAKRVAALWADATQFYIKNGSFPGNEWIQAWKPRF